MINEKAGQIYIVTGASSGIGASVSLKLNYLGYTVIAIGRNFDRLAQLKANAKNNGNLNIEVKDLTADIEKLPEYITSIKNKYGKLQGLIYCAGIPDITPLRALDYDKTKSIFDINYFSPIFLAKGLLDKRNNNKENVSFIAIASLEASLFSKGMSVYCGSKSALIASMKCIAKEYANTGIKINTISPAYVNTPLLDKISQQKIIDKNDTAIIQADEIADMVAYLIGEKCIHTSGSNIIIGNL